MSLNKISDILLKASKIGITYHVSPDGDAVGSVLALLKGLRFLGKDAYVISKEVLSDNLRFLPLSDEITGDTYEPKKGTDVVIVLDCGNSERICANLAKYTGRLLNVDHHLSNDNYGNENYVDTTAAATAEIVYELLQLMGLDFSSSNEDVVEIGSCIYTSIVTDTGGFRHSNVTERTHKIAASLKKIGVNNTIIHQSLFDNKDFSRIKFIGKSISNMQLLFNNKVAVIELPLEFAKEFGIEIGDTSDIISFGLQIKGVEVALLLKEVEDGTKASLRSKTNMDVRRIAEVFGGGGHIKASGIYLRGNTLEEVKDKILEEIKKEL